VSYYDDTRDMSAEQQRLDHEAALEWAATNGITRVEGREWKRNGEVVKTLKEEVQPEGNFSPFDWKR